MSNSRVRLAFVTSVRCALPQVELYISHESTVPKASSPDCARCSDAGDVAKHPGDLRARKIRIERQSGLLVEGPSESAFARARGRVGRYADLATRSRGRRALRSRDPKVRSFRAGSLCRRKRYRPESSAFTPEDRALSPAGSARSLPGRVLPSPAAGNVGSVRAERSRAACLRDRTTSRGCWSCLDRGRAGSFNRPLEMRG